MRIRLVLENKDVILMTVREEDKLSTVLMHPECRGNSLPVSMDKNLTFSDLGFKDLDEIHLSFDIIESKHDSGSVNAVCLHPNSASNGRKSRSSKRCNFSSCTSKPQRMIGICKYCTGNHCSSHRLPESHSCASIEDCRQASVDQLSSKLLNEKCVGNKL